MKREKEIIGVEFKAKASSTTAQAELIRMDDVQQIDRYTTISSDATDIHEHFGKKRKLHNVFVVLHGWI